MKRLFKVGRNQRNEEVELEYSLVEGVFSISGVIKDPDKTEGCDFISFGQIQKELKYSFPEDTLFQRVLSVWESKHLNNMIPGSPKQMKFLRGKDLAYEEACAALEHVGLLKDTSFIREGNSYEYGSEWLTEELGPETLAEIESWSKDPRISEIPAEGVH